MPALGGVCSGGCVPRGVPGLGRCVPGPGGLVSQHALRQTPPPERRLLLRTVRILLECILVSIKELISIEFLVNKNIATATRKLLKF